MADYAPNYTARYRIRYRTLGQVHTAQFRLSRANANPAVAGAAAFSDVLTALGPTLFADWQIIGADVAQEDSDVFLPSTPLPTHTGLSVATGDESFRPLFCSFVGRSTSGQRAAIFFYGYTNSPHSADNTANDFRVTSTESSIVDDVVNMLNLAHGGALVANDNNPIVWYPYMNVGVNAYYQRRARRV